MRSKIQRPPTKTVDFNILVQEISIYFTRYPTFRRMETTADGRKIVREVPDDLKRLVKMIARGFYQHKEDAIVLDYLLRNTIMSETELHELLKFDRKLLRIILNRLQSEHFLKDRLRIVSGKDGKSIKQYYYYINYKAFVNIVKYKLHQMQKRIESQEREDSCKASYTCSNNACSRSYNELDIDKLLDLNSIDPATGDAKMICTFCGREVVERQIEQDDSRQLLIKFNQQMEPIYEILREIENYTLSHEILEPVIDNPSSEQPEASKNGMSGFGGPGVSGSITVDLSAPLLSDCEKAVKEVPSWMKNATIGASLSSPQSASSPAKDLVSKQKEMDRNAPILDGEKIKRTLMSHENKTMSHVRLLPSKGKSATSELTSSSDKRDKNSDDSETSESESDSEQRNLNSGGFQASRVDEEMMSSDEEDHVDDDEVDIVLVNGVSFRFDDVTEKEIAEMSAQEREIYAKIGQKRYSNLVD